jgi:tRNA-modifying protein YgfZ
MTRDLQTVRDSAVAYLEDRACIALTGEDRVRWLNGVLTNDVAALANRKGPRAQYACALTEKGKIIADAIVVMDDELLHVWVPARTAPTLLSHWERYVIMDDVEMALATDRRLLMVQGGRAVKVIEDAMLASRAASYDDLLGGALLDVPSGDAEEILRRLTSIGAIAIEPGDVHTLRVEAARATFGFDFDEKSLVQEAGIEGRAVSFSKGCYHGQEVVCMLENRGHVNKRLVQLHVPPGAPVEAGAEVKADAPIGRVTSVVPREDGSAVALAVVKLAHAKPDAVVKVGDRDAKVIALTS